MPKNEASTKPRAASSLCRGRRAQELDGSGSEQTGQGRPDENRDRVFGHVPKKSERHTRQHGMREGVAQQGELAHHEKGAHQTAADTEQHRAQPARCEAKDP